MKPDEREPPYLNPKVRATVCAEIVKYQENTKSPDDVVIRQLREQGYPDSWAALLVFNAQDLAA